MSTKSPPQAAFLVIGNEILSGKIQDENITFLAQELFALGWELPEIRIVRDCQTQIVASIRELKSRYDHLFTSGGVGPTHDDITLDALAEATERRLVLSPMLAKILGRHYGVETLTPAQQRLAMIPEGATLHYAPESLYPQIAVDNIYPLPGIPSLFRKKFRELKTLWPEVEPPQRRCFKMASEETELAAALGAIAAEHPQVLLGSYPTQVNRTWYLELVLESRELKALDAACQTLRTVLSGRDIPWQE